METIRTMTGKGLSVWRFGSDVGDYRFEIERKLPGGSAGVGMNRDEAVATVHALAAAVGMFVSEQLKVEAGK